MFLFWSRQGHLRDGGAEHVDGRAHIEDSSVSTKPQKRMRKLPSTSTNVRRIPFAVARVLCGKVNPMAKRTLRIVRDHPLLGICEYCNAQFSSGLMPVETAKADIQERFDAHKCKREDGNQAAAQ